MWREHLHSKQLWVPLRIFFLMPPSDMADMPELPVMMIDTRYSQQRVMRC